jgi:predicted SprT family Zn-dependent metalloprotease
MKQQIKTRVHEVVKLAEEKYGFPIHPTAIKIEFKEKGQAAARAYKRNWQYGLVFSVESAALDLDEMMNDTIPHEVAHLVCFWNSKLGKNHDNGWKRVCRSLGGTGARTHAQELTKGRYKTQYLYRMPSGREYRASAVLHRKLQAGKSRRFRDGELIAAEHFFRVISPEEHRMDHMVKVAAYAAKKQVGAPVASKPAATSHKRPTRKPMATTGTPSKLDRCRQLYVHGASRQSNIDAFVVAGCTTAGAATYYAKIKKEREMA